MRGMFRLSRGISTTGRSVSLRLASMRHLLVQENEKKTRTRGDDTSPHRHHNVSAKDAKRLSSVCIYSSGASIGHIRFEERGWKEGERKYAGRRRRHGDGGGPRGGRDAGIWDVDATAPGSVGVGGCVALWVALRLEHGGICVQGRAVCACRRRGHADGGDGTRHGPLVPRGV